MSRAVDLNGEHWPCRREREGALSYESKRDDGYFRAGPAFSFVPLWRGPPTDTRCCARLAIDMSRSQPVSESANLRKQELACLRLESDCLQLADAVRSPSLKLHFMEMAKKWSALAAWGLEHGYRGQGLN